LNHTALETLTDRINYALEITKIKKADLARGVGVTPQVIQFLCSNKTQSSRFTFEIATVLGVDVKWLATGEGEIFSCDDPKQKLLNSYQIVPFVDMHKIEERYKKEDFSLNHFDDFRALYKNREGKIICSKILDSSMSPILPINSEIFIDLNELANTEEGSVVVAYLKNHNSTIIRKIEKIDGDLFLTPNNLELFNKVLVNNEILIIGKVFYCQYEL